MFLGFECSLGGILRSYIRFLRVFTGEKYLTLFMSFFYLSDEG